MVVVGPLGCRWVLNKFWWMVAMGWVSWCFPNSSCWDGQTLWFRIIMVTLHGFPLAFILTLCMNFVVVQWFVGCT